MSWIIPSNSSTRRDIKFLEECKDDAVNKSIPIIDETDPNYFLFTEENLPIPIIEEDKKMKKRTKYAKCINVVEYISAMSKEHEEIPRPQIIIVAQKRRKKKKLQ